MEGLVGLASALWLGVLTSVSPCPLATNVAAMSFVGRRLASPRAVLASGLLYTLGRALTYAVLGGLLVASLLNAPVVSSLLQKYMNKLVGPLLIVVGVFLLELVGLPRGRGGVAEALQGRVERAGVWGAGLLGVVFALTFCPVSAALFFGSLLPLAVKEQSSVLLPLVFGVGTAVPVLAFALLIAGGATSLGRVFDQVARVERRARQATGVLFVVIGVYFSLENVFRVWG
jgi:cytochrome c biogenesis protein CcdA